MPRVKWEFYCTNCQKYFDVKLNITLNGNYRIHCPNCGHIHYRTVENGKITDERFPQNDDKILIEDIRPMKSCCRDHQEETALTTEGNQSGEGFMARLWSERFSGRT